MKLTRLSESILVGHIETPLDGAIVVTPSTPSRSALKELERGNFDQAPVLENGQPVGYVLARDLRNTRGSIRSNMHQILPRALASDTSPLESALPWIAESGFLFLLAGKQVSGFVVPSDLNKQAGRSYFYLGLSELEIRLADAIRKLAPGVDLLECLRPAAAKRVRNRVQKMTDSNVEADAVAKMMLSELFDIAGNHTDIPERLGVDNWSDFWRPINGLRIRIAHPTKPVLANQADLNGLLRIDDAVHSLIDVVSESKDS